MAAKGDAKKGVKKEASKAGADSRGRGAGEDDGTSLPSPPALVDELFPRWEAASPAAKGDQYQDEAGRVLPKALKKVVDAWKRPGELVAGMTEVPVYAQSVALPSSVEGGEEQVDSEEGAVPETELYAGSKDFEWLLSVFVAVKERIVEKEAGASLWQLVYPQDEKTGAPVASPTGRYEVKLFIVDSWRRVTVDDDIPVDIFGMPLLIGCRPLQLWPLLVTKALFKVMHAYKCLDMKTPRSVAALGWLTGWHYEVMPLSLEKVNSAYDKIQEGLMQTGAADISSSSSSSSSSSTIVTCNLKKMAKPSKPPPRMLVLCGPDGAGREQVGEYLTSEFKGIGYCISHTTRKPREHEVDGRHHFFVSDEEMDAKVAEDFFLMQEDVYGGEFSRGYSLSTVRDVAASGLMCVLTVDTLGARALKRRPGVDAMYVFVGPQSLEEYESYLHERLVEDESTIQLRVHDAKTSLERLETEGEAFEVLVDRDYEDMYAQTKTIISQLSPVIRNRLKGLPAYVLDYADVIPSNSVERPVAKPVLLAGPPSMSKTKMIIDLMSEFPDVFSIPTIHTTDREMALKKNEVVSRKRVNSLEEERPTQSLAERKLYVYVTEEEFDALEASGDIAVLSRDKFVHDTLKQRHAITKASIMEVVDQEKLCLIDLDVQSALAFGDASGGMDAMMLAVLPESLEAFETEVRGSLHETEADVKKLMDAAARDMESCSEEGLYDHIVMEPLGSGRSEEMVREILSENRPDIAPPRKETNEGAVKKPIFVCCDEDATDVVVESLASVIGLSKNALTPIDVVHINEDEEGLRASDIQEKVTAGECLEYERDETTGAPKSFISLTDLKKRSEDGIVSLGHVSLSTALAVAEAADVGARFLYFATGLDEDVSEGDEEGAAAAAADLMNEESTTEEQIDPENGAVILSASEGATIGALRKRVADSGCSLTAHFGLEKRDIQSELYLLMSDLEKGCLPPLPRPVVICGPGGTGKLILLRMLQERYPHGFAQPQTTTSREPRSEQEMVAGAFDFMDPEEMAQAISDGDVFLDSAESFEGTLYGITRKAVTRVQCEGRIAVVLVDTVSAATSMRREKAFDAFYIFLRLSNADLLADRLSKIDIDDEERAMRLDTYVNEIESYGALTAETTGDSGASAAVFDYELQVDDVEKAYFRLADAISNVDGSVLPLSDVWGYGRCLWDESVRVPGDCPLRLCVLGPALSGKTIQCELLSARFRLPHIAVGDLLRSAVEGRTELGVRARRYIDASRNVPDDIIVELLKERLEQEDCRRFGWLLDGFPKTVEQAKRLTQMKIVPDKVVFLSVEWSDLYKRSEGRRIDPVTGKTYSVSVGEDEGGAGPGEEDEGDSIGSLPEEVQGRLTIRHDDLEENVTARLTHYERNEPALRKVYHEISHYVDGGVTKRVIFQHIETFITTEDRLSRTMHVSPASTLSSPDYIVLGAQKYQRQRLLKLKPLSGGGISTSAVWVDLSELPQYVSDFVLLRDQTHAGCTRHIDSLSTNSLTGSKMLYIDAPEPVSISVSLGIGPQPPASDGHAQKSALVISGCSGVGKSTLIELLKQEFPDKFGFSVSHTTRSPRPGEVDGVDYHFTSREAMKDLMSEGYFLESAEVHGNLYGTSYEAVEKLAREGRMCILDIDVQGAANVRRNDKIEALFVFVEPPSLAILEERLRGRNTDDDDTIMKRVNNAHEEIARSMDDGLFDHRIVNDNVLTAYRKLKLIVSENWAKKDEPLLCHMSFDLYDPATSATRSMLRFASASSASTTLHIPRGRTLVRTKAEPGFIYRAELCCSETEFEVGDVGDVLSDHADKKYSVFRGVVPAAAAGVAGEWGLLARKIFKIDGSRSTHVEADLRLSSPQMESYAVLAFVDNDTGKESVFLSGRMPRVSLAPNTNGYSIISYYQRLGGSTSGDAASESPSTDVAETTAGSELSRGEWVLSVISDEDLTYTEIPSGSQSSAQLSDAYSPNKRALLCSYRLKGSVHQVLSMHFSITCGMRAVFRVVLARGGRVVREWDEVTTACTFLGIPLEFGDSVSCAGDGAVQGEAEDGVYTISIFLCRNSCPFKIQPAGAIDVPLSWRLQLEAPFELEVTKDDTMEKSFIATLATWNDVGAGGPDKRPTTAKAALEKFLEEQQRELQAGATDDASGPAAVEVAAAKEKDKEYFLRGKTATRVVDGSEEPLELDKEASFVVVSHTKDGVYDEHSTDDEDVDATANGGGLQGDIGSMMGSMKRLYYDKEASLYVPALQEVEGDA